MSTEKKRLEQAGNGTPEWKRWGPYLAERQWGTVREDYSPGGTAWEYVSHDASRSRAYRWGEDGLGGISDWKQRLCMNVALWNGKDPILKERLFGLTGNEGNHGEDVKEYYYYLDSTPTHSYMKMLYKYPQVEFPYQRLVEENGKIGKDKPEFELLDTGVFEENRYFDVTIEYAKPTPNDVYLKVTALNHGPEDSQIDIIPQLWFRNTWAWEKDDPAPTMTMLKDGSVEAEHPRLGTFHFYASSESELMFCENETNHRRLFGSEISHAICKDGFHEYVVNNDKTALQAGRGTKAGYHQSFTVPAGESVSIYARLTDAAVSNPLEDASRVFEKALEEANEFYKEIQADVADPDLRNVQRQAFAGMLWTKQFYHFDVRRWIDGDPSQPDPPEHRRHGRNADWRHLYNKEIISMPDKWEYPWYAAWDLAFHCIPLAMVDREFAKEQLILMTREWYMHPNGQLPAYEWAFGDVNPPVHAWATWRVFQIDKKLNGDKADYQFLERVFHKLMLNFTWWVNRKDAEGKNIFQGGFLGLDNIGVFDRSAPLPTGGHINQADGTSWMAMYSLNLMRIALELALKNPAYEDIASKFFEHFLHIAESMTNIAGEGVGLWDAEDKFYYDVLKMPDGEVHPLRVRSMVGLIPLFAVETLEPEMLERLPGFRRRMEWFLKYRPDLADLVSRWHEPGRGERRLLSLLRGHRMKALLQRMLDPEEFLSDFGIRALSKYHEENPYQFDMAGTKSSVGYQPAESDTTMFGGNSNWRGPIWFPVNYLLIESLQKFHHYYGDDFKVECPVGSGEKVTLLDAAEEISRRLIRIFTMDESGRRPVYEQYERMQSDPNFRDNILFYEFFHGDNGRGVGASHQTGWTGLVAKLIQPRSDRTKTQDSFLEDCSKKKGSK